VILRVGAGVLAAILLGGGATAAAAPLSLSSQLVTVFRVNATVPLTSCTAGATADAYVTEPLSGAGTETELRVASAFGANKRSFLRLDLASCAIPTVARVTSAALRLHLSTAPGSSRTYDVFRVTASWVESLTWVTQPAVAASASASAATGTTAGVTLAWNVLTDTAAFVAGTQTNNGWRVSDRTESNLTAIEGRFSAREHASSSQRPALAVSWYP
jgi:hypothetical protein